MGSLLRGRDGSEGRDSGWLGASGAPPSCHQPAGRVRLVRGPWPAFGRPYTRWVVLLGRTAEQEAVARLLAAARLGRGGVLVVTGEPGIGKTALLTDAVSGLTDMNVRVMTGTLAEQDLPFAALHGILRPALPLLDDIPARQAEALGAALLLRPGGSSDRFAIGAATLSLLSRYAEEKPLVVLIDDAQWLDVPSLEALAFASRRLHEDPVAV